MKLTTALAAGALALALAGAVATSGPAGAELKLTGDEAHTFVIDGTSVSGLHPGSERSTALRVRNPYPFDLRLTRLRGDVVDSSSPDCPAHPGNLTAGPHQGRLPLTVRARQSRDAGSIPIRMPASVTNECSGVTFTIRITGVATKVNK
ncbi:hypothetical protein Ais01nite_30030 [Asanoa ishikariensis]|uniref:SipW-cognate class signal peptide n=1 Tax=Asanoa ishikariensis TaxID=137265 RepID=A0A1H3QJI4_9ACTN|nr:hypothetical protein [Asanoa ishikariensis]GIF64968.1 hypothetical protein Ais01nite_30030 [Asanoa ishikariensis]SDZ13463.1 hypothetical protein SAMN05421684_2919 [Asanoa ishikariensis]